MTIREIISSRGIEEILHFTTNFGLTGILAAKAVKARSLLPEDRYLEHVYLYNCEDRRWDAAWHGYVNLSITKVNWRLFSISMFNWHRDLDGYWCILSFDPVILTHPGVFFCTTNNRYTGVKRGKGVAGLEQLFADRVVRWDGNVIVRNPNTPSNQPTCEQAEALYPDQLSLDYLTTIYVKSGEDADSVKSLVDTLGKVSDMECVVRPRLFEE